MTQPTRQAGNGKRQLLISIHDVMPATLDRTARIIDRLKLLNMNPVTLLVVPGTGWDPDTISQLRSWVGDGIELAGHGWKHRVDRIRGLRHRLHSVFISRDVAEHLALDRDAAVNLMQRCHRWFEDNGLPAPTLYVPPAWAMGDVPHASLDALPYRHYEVLTGVYTARQGFRRLPMVGFEADTRFRAWACRAWNSVNLRSAGTERPLRLSIHPDDPELLLGEDLEQLLVEGGNALAYNDLDTQHRIP